MTALATTTTDITARPALTVEPATVAAVRAALGSRRPPGARPGRRRPGEPDPKVDRLDLLGQALTPDTATLTVLWLSSTRRASAATRAGYADDLLAWADWYARTRSGRLDLAVLTRADVTLWLTERQAAGDRPATIQRRLVALSSLYRYAASHGLPLVCPVTEDHRPQVERGRHDRSARALTDTEVRAMFQACADIRDALVLGLLFTDGLRVSELCGADDDDVLTEGRRCTLRVRRKGGRTVRVALDPTVCDLIDAYRQIRPAPTGGEPAPLVADLDGRRIDRWDVTRLLRRVARAAGIRDHTTLGPHALRASAITDLIEQGRPVTEVQGWSGHRTLQQVLGYYEAHKRDERNAAMSADLARLVELPDWVQVHRQS